MVGEINTEQNWFIIGTYCQIHRCIDTKSCFFGWKCFPCSHDEVRIARAGLLPTNELGVLLTSKRCIVRFTQGKEMWSQISRNYLSSIYKDICSEQSECINS